MVNYLDPAKQQVPLLRLTPSGESARTRQRLLLLLRLMPRSAASVEYDQPRSSIHPERGLEAPLDGRHFLIAEPRRERPYDV